MEIVNAAVLLSLLLGVAYAVDSAEVKDGLEFIYHETHNLMLTIRNGTCYFSTIPDDQKRLMQVPDYRTKLQDRAEQIIGSNDSTVLLHTSLNSVRDEYADLLANYHCINMDIYSLELFLPDTITCDFETTSKPHCGYTQAATDSFDWSQGSGPTPTQNTGPTADHTKGVNGTGHYMYIESSEPQETNYRAQLISEVYNNPDDSTFCLRFFYHMYGFGMGTLNVYAAQSPSQMSNLVWSQSGDQGDQWKEAEIDISPSGDFQVVFEGVRGRTYFSDVAIDDISVSRGPCKPPITCNFDSWSDRMCGFTHDSSADFNWTLWSGPTDTSATGPPADHTYGANATPLGNYMYLESGEPRLPNNTARLIKHVPGSADGPLRCLRFFYHMYGADIGTLNIYTVTDASLAQLPASIWTASGDQGDVWKDANVTIPLTTDFQLVFEGVIGPTYRPAGDTAIDDITISDGACPVDTTAATTTDTSPTVSDITTHTESPTPVSTYSQPATSTHTQVSPCRDDHTAIFKCCFEDDEEDSGWCNIRQGSHDGFDWTRHQGSTPTWDTGPNHDHSLGNQHGHYIFIDAANHAKLLASIITQPFLVDGRHRAQYCLKFYYHMYGDHIGSLHVHVTHIPDLYSTVNQVGQPILRIDGNQGNGWKEALIEFSTQWTFEIDFEGFSTWGPQGDIAIDDIYLYNGPCTEHSGVFVSETVTPAPTTPVTSSGHFAPTTTVRLVGGASHTSGRLEIMFNGQWGTVCKEQFTNQDAQMAEVVCRMLGMTGGYPGVLAWIDTRDGTSPIWMHDVRCFGHESSLMECHYQNGSGDTCQGHHDYDMGIYCGSPCYHNGHQYHDGQIFADCGTCTCVDSHVHCDMYCGGQG